ncbi:pilus assembly protein TadG-related protein [Limibacillus halophilus]
MKSLILRFIKDTSAVAILYVTIGLPVFLGITALAVDGGYIYYLKTRAQAAADASALRGAAFYDGTNDSATVAEAVKAGFNNLPPDRFEVTLTSANIELGRWTRLPYPNTGFTTVGSPVNAVRATVNMSGSSAVQLFFAQALGFATQDVLAEAVAVQSGGTQDACLLALDPSAAQSFQVTGNSNMTLLDCGVQVNSTDSKAATKASGASLNVELFGLHNDFNVAGTCEGCDAISSGTGLPVVNAWTGTDPDSPGTMENPSFTHRDGRITPDPFGNLSPDPMDMLTSMGYGAVAWDGSWTTSSPMGINPSTATSWGSGDLTGSDKVTDGATISPGVYTNISVASTASTVTFEPGVYVIDGGLLDFSNSDVNAQGVTFVLVNGAEITMSGNGELNLVAPDDADSEPAKSFAGFVVYEEPDGSSTPVHKLSGTGDSVIDGAFYSPSGKVTFAGDVNNGASASDCFMVVSNQMEFLGGGGSASNISFSAAGCAGFGVSALNSDKIVSLVE